MTIDELKVYLEDVSRFLNADNVIGEREAEIRAGKFLEAQFKIAMAANLLSADLFKLESFRSVTYAHVVGVAEGKNITEKKLVADADPTFTSAQERYSGVESDLNYLKTVGRVFADAHVFYRQKAKGETNNVSFQS